MAKYETVIIVKPQLSDAQVTEFLDKTKKVIAQEGGEILGEDLWGRRKLAYPIQASREGFYALIKFQGPGAVLARLDHYFHVSDSVMRTMTVRGSELKPRPPKKPKPAKVAGAAPAPARQSY